LDKERIYQNLDSLVFQDKNQEYGAFVQRKNAAKQHAWSAIAGISIILLSYLIPLLITLSLKKDSSELIRSVEAEITPYSELMNPPPIPDEPKPPEAMEVPPQVATKRFVKPEVRPDDEVMEEELIPTVQELKDANPGYETREGSADIHAVYNPGKVVVDSVVKPEPKEQVYNFVERFPKFPDGEEAMQLFIARNIIYPEVAMNAGIQGTVIVQFVVDSQGNITQPLVVRDIGGGCGQAAIDVIMKMPKWIPGEQNGLPVSVRCTLPVRFRLVK
jgi:protein TonB